MTLKTLHRLKIVNSLLLYFTAIVLLGQGTPSEGESFFIPREQSLSPTAYQFLKQGVVPVNEYNGTPNISVPIYTIKEPGLNLSISLAYNASGIKVSEEASWVGLGWDIALGSIVQVVKGGNDLATTMILPDHVTSGGWPPYPVVPPLGVDEIKSDPDGTFSFAAFVEQSWPGLGTTDVAKLVDQSLNHDSQPDIFIASFFGHSVKFMLDPELGHPIILNKKGYVVTSTASGLKNRIWSIKTPSGDTYNFHEITHVCTSSSGGQSIAVTPIAEHTNVVDPIDPCSENLLFGNSIWRLTSIDSHSGGSIDFIYGTEEYTTSDYSSFRKNVISESVYNAQVNMSNLSGGKIEGVSASNSRSRPGSPVGSKLVSSSIWKSANASTTTFRALNEIQFSTGKVVFYTSPSRLDRRGDIQLDSIVIKNTGDERIDAYAFDYDYFTSDLVGYGVQYPKSHTEITKRLKLISLTSNKNGSYRFRYDPTVLPPKNATAVDYWGYHNGQLNNNSDFANILRFGNQLAYPQLREELEKNTSNHSSSLKYAKSASLHTIVYPTGGRSEFEYELNTFQNYMVPDIELDHIPSSQTKSKGHGLRISSITNRDIDNEFIDKLEYDYYDGVAVIPQKFFFDETESIAYYAGSSTEGTGYRYSFYSTIIKPVNVITSSTVAGGDYVGYGRVEKRQVDSQGNALGKTVNWYHNVPFYTQPSIDSRLSVQSLPTGIENGSLISSHIYNSQNILVDKTVNSYEYDLISSYRYGVEHAVDGFFKEEFSPLPALTPKLHTKCTFYPIFVHHTNRTKSVQTRYAGSDSLVIVSDYSYNNLNFLSTKETTSSEGDVISERYHYPFDYNPDGFSATERSTLNSMASLGVNILSPVIYTERLKNGHLYVKLTAYKSFGGKYLPSATRSRYFGSFKTDFEVLRYNGKGNIVEAKGRDGIVSTYFWGYANAVPIAIIHNATVAEIATTLGQTVSQVLGYNEQDIHTIDGLRSQLPMARVFTFSHKPLVGIISSTDPNGLTSEFTYDEVNRLWKTIDVSDHILSEFNYNIFNGQ